MLNSKKIAISGIAIAFIIISLYLGTIIKNNRIFFIALATYFEVLPVLIGGIKIGFMAYIASSILAIFLIPNKVYAYIYIIIGIYPIVKLLCEKYNVYIEFTFKYLWFNIILILNYYIAKKYMLINDIMIKNREIILIIFIEILFFIYDYVFTVFINFANNKIFKGSD